MKGVCTELGITVPEFKAPSVLLRSVNTGTEETDLNIVVKDETLVCREPLKLGLKIKPEIRDQNGMVKSETKDDIEKVVMKGGGEFAHKNDLVVKTECDVNYTDVKPGCQQSKLVDESQHGMNNMVQETERAANNVAIKTEVDKGKLLDEEVVHMKETPSAASGKEIEIVSEKHNCAKSGNDTVTRNETEGYTCDSTKTCDTSHKSRQEVLGFDDIQNGGIVISASSTHADRVSGPELNVDDSGSVTYTPGKAVEMTENVEATVDRAENQVPGNGGVTFAGTNCLEENFSGTLKRNFISDLDKLEGIKRAKVGTT